MVINRRAMIGLVSSLPFLQLLKTYDIDDLQHGLVSALSDGEKFYILVQKHSEQIKIPISFQPHGILSVTGSKLLVIGKRPCDLMAVINLKKGIVSKLIQLPYGRHFWGHGAYDLETDSIYLTEYDFENEKSIFSHWNVNSMTQVDMFPSYGISGHDILIDDQLLYCANGGFKTSPEFGRMILNQQIHSSITIIDKINHKLISLVQPFDKHMSFRHMCQTQNTVFIGLQNKTNSSVKNETIIAALEKTTLNLTSIITEVDGSKGYITSIENFKNKIIIATSHINDRIYFIDAQTKKMIKMMQLDRPQGIQISNNSILVTTENGLIEFNDKLNINDFWNYPIGDWQNHCLS